MTDLSPVPIPPRPIPLPYELAWTDLPDYTTAGRCHVSHAIRGLHQTGNSCICTLSYLAGDRDPRRITVFIKRAAASELYHHHFLAERGFPVPALLAHTDVAMVLDFVPTVGIRPAEADQLLRLIRRLNAIEPAFAPPPGTPGEQFNTALKSALHQLSADGYYEAYGKVVRETRQLPTALTHGELAFQPVGRSADRMVLLDLATLGARPRLFDVANVLRTLADLTQRDELDLLGSYLGRAPARSELRELVLTRALIGFEGLPWRVARGQGAPALARLEHDLAQL